MLPKIFKVTEMFGGMKHTIELGNAAVKCSCPPSVSEVALLAKNSKN
jgi:hypothetical protein